MHATNPTARPKAARSLRRFLPRMWALEDRCTPATFYVDPAFTGAAAGSSQTYNNYTGQTPVAGVIIGQNGFATVGAAITASQANGTEADIINLAGTTIPLNNASPGPIVGGVTGGNSVSLVGSGVGATVLQPTNNTQGVNGVSAGLVSVLQAAGAGSVLNLSALTFDGLAGTRNIGRAVSYINGSSGTINNVTIQNVAFGADGYAVSALNGSTVTVTGSTLQNYGRAGVTVSASTATIQSNTITGQGAPNRLNYAVQTNNGSTVTVNANTIQNNLGGQADSAGNFVVSAAVFTSTSTTASPVVRIYGNNIANNQAGVLVDSNADSGVTSSTVLVYANNFSGSQNGAIQAPTSTAGAVNAPNNYYGGQAPVLNAANGISENVATSGSFLTAPAPVLAAETAERYSQLTGIPLTPGLFTFAVGAGGGAPRVSIYGNDGTKTATVTTGLPSSFTGGVRVAQADVDGDGIADTIVGTGQGTTNLVKVISGKDNTTVLASFSAFETSFTGGVFVAAADLNGDGKAEVVVTPDQSGGAVVAVYNGASLTSGSTPAVVARFFGLADRNGNADSGFRGGARPALADVTGDGTPDLILSAGFLGGPRITLWSGVGIAAANGGNPTINPLANFFAFEQSLRNGAFVGGVDLNSDGKADPIFGGGPGGGPRVRIADAAAVLAGGFSSLDDASAAGATISNFFAGNAELRGGVRVLGRDLDGDGIGDVVIGSGDDSVSDVRIYPGSNINKAPNAPALSQDINPFNSVLSNGVYVG